MKSNLLVTIFVIAILQSCCKRKMIISYSKASFDVEKYDFGKLDTLDSVDYSFNFFNYGDTVLHIYKLDPLCGCTKASIKANDINIGEHGELCIRFKPDGFEPFLESILVYYNGTDSPIELQISGN